MLNNFKKKQNKYIGKIGEDIACEFLKRKSFSIICRNYTRKWGEIDIIGAKEGTVHFFEVKSTTFRSVTVSDIHKPEENVHNLKLLHIRRMIQTFLGENNFDDSVSFSFHVLTVHIDEVRKIGRVYWIKDIIL